MGAYSNPKMYYYPDATAFSRSFQSAFKDTYGALSNITAKQASLDVSYIADRKKSKQNLDKTVNSAVQNNEKLYNGIVGATSGMMNDWSAGNILQTDDEKAEATQTFNNFIIPINNATTAAYDPNYDADADLDHGAEYFVERKNIEEGIRDGRISTDFKWDKTNKKFVGTMSVLDEKGNVMTDSDGKALTFNPEQISTIYGNTSPEARQEIDARYDAEVKGIANQVQTMIKDLNTEDKFRNQSKYRSKDDVLNEFVNQALGLEVTGEGFGAKFAAGKVSKETVKNINDYYNNHVDYSPAEKVQMFKQNPALAGLQDKDLLWIADLGFNTQEEVAEYLKKATNQDPKKIQGYVDAITEERTKMVGNAIKTRINEEYSINDLMNKYQAPPTVKNPSPSGTNTQVEGYSEKKFGEIGSFLGGSTPIPDEEGGFVGVGNFQEEYGTTYNTEMDKIFLNQKISTDVGDKDIKGVLYNPDTKEIAFSYVANKNMKLKVDKDGRQEFGDLGDKTDIFDLSDPVAFEKLYLKIGTKADGESRDARAYEVKYKQLAQNYGLQNFYNHLFDDGTTGKVDVNNRQFAGKKVGGMQKWVTYTLANNKEDIYNHFKDGNKYKVGGRDAGAVMITNPVTGTKQTLKSYIDGINTFRGYTPNTQ